MKENVYDEELQELDSYKEEAEDDLSIDQKLSENIALSDDVDYMSEQEYTKACEEALKQETYRLSTSDAFEKDDRGRLVIKDSTIFARMIAFTDTNNMSTPQAVEVYSMLKEYGFKQFPAIAAELNCQVPFAEVGPMLDFAIAKTIKEFDASKGGEITTVLYNRIKSELTTYKQQQASLRKALAERIQNPEDGSEYARVYNEDLQANEVILIESETTEEKYERSDLFRRQMIAFRMAFSGLPLLTQTILYATGLGKTLTEIKNMVSLEETKVNALRNRGLSLLLQRVLRSRHLDDSEKLEVLKLHGLVDDWHTNLDEAYEELGFNKNTLGLDDREDV